MRDVLAPESSRRRALVGQFADVVEAAAYQELVLPLVEDLGVFLRVGEATDVVTKEMYDFVDKGGRHVALRPELTASVCRAFVQHRPATPWKVWYTGSQFRYEKPQRGRYRQFDQVGIEVLGADDPYLDVEVIALGWEFYRALGLQRFVGNGAGVGRLRPVARLDPDQLARTHRRPAHAQRLDGGVDLAHQRTSIAWKAMPDTVTGPAVPGSKLSHAGSAAPLSSYMAVTLGTTVVINMVRMPPASTVSVGTR